MTANRFDWRIIRVTGGNSGMGLTTTGRLVAEADTVVIGGRNRETLNCEN
jgi:short-subunit dehydrogenase involved in D-alanine esterification of teichoic acids